MRRRPSIRDSSLNISTTRITPRLLRRIGHRRVTSPPLGPSRATGRPPSARGSAPPWHQRGQPTLRPDGWPSQHRRAPVFIGTRGMSTGGGGPPPRALSPKGGGRPPRRGGGPAAPAAAKRD